jgi:hypothetical protein
VRASVRESVRACALCVCVCVCVSSMFASLLESGCFSWRVCLCAFCFVCVCVLFRMCVHVWRVSV